MTATYLQIALLVLFASGLLAILPALFDRIGFPIRGSHWLRIGNSALLCSLLFPLFALLLPREALLRPAAQVWSGISRSGATSPALGSPLATHAISSHATPELPSLAFFHQAIGAGICLMLLVLLARVLRLRRCIANQPVIKSIGRVRVLAFAEGTPFSAWLPGRSYIVLPLEMLSHRGATLIAVRHEAQHHRQGDTRWVYALELVKALFFWNPGAYWLARTMNQLQEFACDEALIGHRKLSPRAYGSCLLKAAELAAGSRPVLVGTTGMAAGSSGRLLRRRIEMLFRYETRRPRKGLALLVAMGTLSLLASVAFAARSSLQDRSLTLDEAERYAEIASRGSSIPITVNELVLARLNRYVGRPEGRKFIKDSLARMPRYQKMIERKIDQYAMPRELIALALHESGFKNDLISPRPHHAAGIWQFVPGTARRYGLAAPDKLEEMVPGKDERFDAEKETDAAMRYLRDLNAIFKDWRLALKAYNEGESRVLKLIEQHDTRDPWQLERLSTKESYLSGAMAMIIILKNPSLLD